MKIYFCTTIPYYTTWHTSATGAATGVGAVGIGGSVALRLYYKFVSKNESDDDANIDIKI